jgi:hypothetical protein
MTSSNKIIFVFDANPTTSISSLLFFMINIIIIFSVTASRYITKFVVTSILHGDNFLLFLINEVSLLHYKRFSIVTFAFFDMLLSIGREWLVFRNKTSSNDTIIQTIICIIIWEQWRNTTTTLTITWQPSFVESKRDDKYSCIVGPFVIFQQASHGIHTRFR